MAMTEATPTQTSAPLTAQDHARAMADYSRAGEARAWALGNRGQQPRRERPGRDDHAVVDELVDDVDRNVQQPARIASQVDDQALHPASSCTLAGLSATSPWYHAVAASVGKYVT